MQYIRQCVKEFSYGKSQGCYKVVGVEESKRELQKFAHGWMAVKWLVRLESKLSESGSMCFLSQAVFLSPH
jgi:hypothetical protein